MSIRDDTLRRFRDYKRIEECFRLEWEEEECLQRSLGKRSFLKLCSRLISSQTSEQEPPRSSKGKDRAKMPTFIQTSYVEPERDVYADVRPYYGQQWFDLSGPIPCSSKDVDRKRLIDKIDSSSLGLNRDVGTRSKTLQRLTTQKDESGNINSLARQSEINNAGMKKKGPKGG